MPDLTQYFQLGGTVVTVVLFLNYLTKRDNKWTDSLHDSSTANVTLATALQKLTDRIERNTEINVGNTAKIAENVKAVVENTVVTDKNTQETAKNTNGS